MAEWYSLADLRTRILDADGPFFDAIPFRSSDYDRCTPIMCEIKRDGVVLEARSHAILDIARTMMIRGLRMLEAELFEDVGRAAYLTAFHAADL
jgi:hypothetical protein